MKISISGIRGIYRDDDLDFHGIIKFSKLFSSFIGNNKKCVIGRDTRPSSNIILHTIIAVLIEQGFEVFNLDISTTPMIFRESKKYGSAIMITASHNPLEWNGLKFILNGRGIFQEELNSMLNGSVLAYSKTGELINIKSNYLNEILELMNNDGYLNDNVKKNIGIDSGGGAASNYSINLFKMLGHNVYSVNDIASISSRTPDPTTDNLDELKILVRTNKLIFGFAFDMDGDRLVVVDNNGNKLEPDLTLLLCIANTLNHGLKKYVTSIDTSYSVANIIRTHGGELIYSKVGEANVVKKIIESNSDVGGEGSSGGFILPRFNMCRDGILAAAIISTMDKSLIDECMNIASKYSAIRSKVSINSYYHNKIIEKLENKYKESYQLITSDGIKVLIDDESWILIRPSNTEDVLRISVESHPDKVLLLYKETREEVMKAYEQIK